MVYLGFQTFAFFELKTFLFTERELLNEKSTYSVGPTGIVITVSFLFLDSDRCHFTFYSESGSLMVTRH